MIATPERLVANIEHLLRVEFSPCAEHFTFITSFNLHNSPADRLSFQVSRFRENGGLGEAKCFLTQGYAVGQRQSWDLNPSLFGSSIIAVFGVLSSNAANLPM